jgi:hypothetical protein
VLKADVKEMSFRDEEEQMKPTLIRRLRNVEITSDGLTVYSSNSSSGGGTQLVNWRPSGLENTKEHP